MSAVLLFAVTGLDPDVAHVELPDGESNLVQLDPLYDSEPALVQEKGVTEFLATETARAAGRSRGSRAGNAVRGVSPVRSLVRLAGESPLSWRSRCSTPF
ncbi:hypothetical protein [Actinomadura sp. DC4]|uniref:hypothetical protein n=1 Tax=Actinomadura sp. DC4 TaxID=3055069 RepID=UPI00339DA28A